MFVSSLWAGIQTAVFLLYFHALPSTHPLSLSPSPTSLSGPTAPLGHIFLLMQPILGKPLSNSSSSVLLTYCSFLPSLCFKVLLLFSPLGFPFSFFWTYLLCNFFSNYSVIRATHLDCIVIHDPGNPEQPRKLKYGVF